MAKEHWTKQGVRIYKKSVPVDVYRILLIKQAEIKIACNCQYSIEQTIYKMIRAAKDLPITIESK